MKVIASSEDIPGVESVSNGHLYLGESKRSALHLKLSGAISREQLDALLGGEITVGEGDGAVIYEGYNAVHDCTVALIRVDDAERAMAELQETQEALAATQEAQALLVRVLAPRLTDTEALALTTAPWPLWQPGTAHQAEEIVSYGDMLYRVVQSHTSQSHQPPGGEGMLAVYRPVQAEVATEEVLPWISGEEIKLGDRRVHKGVIYECIAPGGAAANVHTPDIVPAVWRVVV